MTTPRFIFSTVSIALVYFCFTAAANGSASIKTGSAVYTWQQNATADWQSPASWTPERTNPVSSDILIFSGGGTTTATNVPSETIGQLIVSGDTTVNLESGVDVTLTVSGDDGDGLTVGPGSALNFTGAHAIATRLTTGVFAQIKGAMTFSSTAGAAHRFTAADPGAIRFETGSVFTAKEGLTGNPFGTTDLGSVIFNEGSTYICFGGGDPFGAAEPSSVVVFEKGSLFSLRADVPESFFSGRTYANFELFFPGRDAWTDADSALVMDDLTVVAGTLYLYAHGSPGHAIKGNITVEPGARLSFQDYFPGHTVNLNGESHQTITNFGQIGANPGNTIAITNHSGVTVNPGFIAWNLELIDGVVTVDHPSGYMRVPGTVSRVNGYIDGYLSRDLDLNGIYTFDVGTKNGYSPVSVRVNAVNGDPPGMLVRAVESPQPNIQDPSKALSRHWQINGGPSIVSADLTFHYLDPTDVPPTANESNFVIQRFRGGFTQPPGVIDTETNTFTLTSQDFFAVIDWTLAEPEALGTPTPTATPTASPTDTPTATPTATPTGTPKAGAALFDFDGDHRADISVYRPVTGDWYLQRSGEGFTGVNFGSAEDWIVPADYDGDGKTDVAVYRPSTAIWYVLNSSDGSVVYHNFGLAEDLPTPADYDGDGKADISVFRPSSGTWYRLNSSDGSFSAVQFGADGDKPTLGDFDGDGKADIAVFRQSDGVWYQMNSSDGTFFGEQFGISTDKITPADFDGDGKTDIAIYRPSDGLWYVKNSATATYTPYVFGVAEDIPTPGDFDGDGKADIAVFRPSDGTWYIVNSSTGGYTIQQFGQGGDRPTPSAYGN